MNKKTVTHLLKFGGGVVALALAALLLVWPPARALACACCAEPGAWFETNDRIDSYELSELNRVNFDAVAHTYLTEAGEDSLKGISHPADEYAISVSKRQRRWELKFRDKEGHAGTLALTIPATLTDFGVDLHEVQEGSGETVLYKEWRLTGAVTGTGIFSGGSTTQTKYRLILQGRGNSCTSAETFAHWRLEVFGPRASYSFYGSFKDPAPPAKS